MALLPIRGRTSALRTLHTLGDRVAEAEHSARTVTASGDSLKAEVERLTDAEAEAYSLGDATRAEALAAERAARERELVSLPQRVAGADLAVKRAKDAFHTHVVAHYGAIQDAHAPSATAARDRVVEAMTELHAAIQAWHGVARTSLDLLRLAERTGRDRVPSLPHPVDELRRTIRQAQAAGVPVPLPEPRPDYTAKIVGPPPVGRAVFS